MRHFVLKLVSSKEDHANGRFNGLLFIKGVIESASNRVWEMGMLCCLIGVLRLFAKGFFRNSVIQYIEDMDVQESTKKTDQ